MKQFINPFTYAETILNAVKGGALLTSKNGDRCNTMTIGWGTMGIEWNKPIFVAFVRQSRFTKQLLDATGTFTINVPMGEINKDILRVCGTISGRDADKIAQLDLTPCPPEVIDVPGLRELPLTLECKVLFSQEQSRENILDGGVRTRYEGDDADLHTAYYAEIVSAYIIED